VGEIIGLVGPGMYLLVLLVLLDALAAAFLVLDAMRRPATDYAGVVEGRWAYIVPQALYAALYAVAQVPSLSSLMPWANSYPLLTVPIVAQQLAYLLRVVFPTHGRLEARLEARFRALAEAAGIEGEEDPAIARSTTNA
jgi:hypothetical protein